MSGVLSHSKYEIVEDNSMALVKCPDCGKELSDQAVSCPNCGRPITTPAKQNPTNHRNVIQKRKEIGWI